MDSRLLLDHCRRSAAGCASAVYRKAGKARELVAYWRPAIHLPPNIREGASAASGIMAGVFRGGLINDNYRYVVSRGASASAMEWANFLWEVKSFGKQWAARSFPKMESVGFKTERDYHAFLFAIDNPTIADQYPSQNRGKIFFAPF